jgi:hypothetical protein
MVGARPRRIPPTDSNTLPMIFSCSDRKPIDHLGIKIPRIGLPCLTLYPQMNAEESRSRFARWVRRCRAGPPTLFDYPGGGYPRLGDSS